MRSIRPFAGVVRHPRLRAQLAWPYPGGSNANTEGQNAAVSWAGDRHLNLRDVHGNVSDVRELTLYGQAM